MAPQLPTSADVLAAAERLAPIVHRTPVLTSRTLNTISGAQLFLKAENFQRTGSFKFRGASNAIALLSPEQKKRGVVAYSSGNHAQALALAGASAGVKVTIVMPSDSPKLKLSATRGYGAEVVLYNRDTETREAVTDAIIARDGGELIKPFDDERVICGQGSAAVELIQDVGELDYLYVCVGGGGLIGGCALAAKALSPSCKVIGVEPEAGDDATRSFKTGVLQSNENPKTIADGARTTSLGKLTFPLLRENVFDMLTVSDGELVAMMKLTMERMKIVIEPTGTLALAGAMKDRARIKGARVGIIISGGNVDAADYARYISS